jgi:hypothetical protein
MRRASEPEPRMREEKHGLSRVFTAPARTSIPSPHFLPLEIQYKILSFLPLSSLLVAMKVNSLYERVCQEHILRRFLSLPGLQFASAKRTLDDTSGVYGLESSKRYNAHEYLLQDPYPCSFRIVSSLLLTDWTISHSEFQEINAAGHRLHTFAITVGERSRWIMVFNRDTLRRKTREKPGKAISVASLLEVYYHDSEDGQVLKGEWTNRRERAKLVYVPETDDWYFTWPLAALVTFGVLNGK